MTAIDQQRSITEFSRSVTWSVDIHRRELRPIADIERREVPTKSLGMTTEKYVSLDEIRAAAHGLPPLVRRTPIWPCAPELSNIGHERLFLKLENLQPTGAYKVRAAFTRVAALNPEQRARGIVLTSTGNFSQAFALAGRYFGVRTLVVMLPSVSEYKIKATQALGAEVDLFDGAFLERQSRVESLAHELGMTAINAREERIIVAGHGTLGLEILEDFIDVEQVLVPVSSGGLAAGVAAAVKQMARDVRVIGVQPVRANAAYLSLAANQLVTIPRWDTIADGVASPCPGRYPFAHLRRYLDEIVLVEEQDIAKAHVLLRRRAKVLAEPAGAVAAAAFFSNRVDRDRRTVAIVSGAT